MLFATTFLALFLACLGGLLLLDAPAAPTGRERLLVLAVGLALVLPLGVLCVVFHGL